jgi:ribose/xylose/arabinose/galactoside ABC-type transport system permease subunit
MTRLRDNLVLAMLVALWIGLVALIAFTQPGILSARTLTSVLQFSTILALVSIGLGLVVLAGGAGIDLSVGGNVSLSAVLAMFALAAGVPAVLLPAICIGIGLLLGAFNGFLVTRLALYPLIVTLGTFYLFSGLALALTGGAALSGVPDWALSWGRGRLGPIPLPFLTLVVPVIVLTLLIVLRTAWGTWILAMGNNDQAAHLSGIPVGRVRLVLYTVMGGLAGLAAFVSLAWLGSARPNIGVNLELEALTAVLLGGIAITGGRGGLTGVIAAVFLVVMLKTALLQSGINTVWQTGAIGLLLIAALLANRFSLSRG